MTRLRRLLAIALGTLAVAGVAALSRVPYRVTEPNEALLRLSWRARGERLERCRPATEAELAGVPAHMRRDTICEGARIPPYRLRIAVDGRRLEDAIVQGSNVEGDRPMYVLREFPIRPGPHRIQVRFEREPLVDDPTGPEPDAAGVAAMRQRAVPPRLALDTTVTVGEHDVVLVTFNDELGRLVVAQSARHTGLPGR